MKKSTNYVIMPLIWIFAANVALSQIVIETGPGVTPEDMVEKLVGDGIFFYNVTFQGADIAVGLFSNGQSTNLGLESGIFLTSGAGFNIPGPNNSTAASLNNGTPGHTYLNQITTSTTYDASILGFEFIPETDTIKFSYVFGGEEYNEWVGSSYNDVFGCFISGINPAGGVYESKNIAIIPGTTNTSIIINNVNNGYSPAGVIPTGPCTNCQYYNDNTGGLTLEYDGLTVVLQALLPVVPCEVYQITMGVADAGDGIYDCGVFIEKNSLSSLAKITYNTFLDPPGLTEDMVEGHVGADLVFKLPGVEYAPVTICFEITGTAINGIDYEEIYNCITFDEGEDSAVIHVTPLQDEILEDDETIILIVENTLGCFIRYDTVELTILNYPEMTSSISPGSTVCSGQTVELWVNVENGFPPYTFNWQPGAFTNDTIIVAPEETTTYSVTYMDILNVAGTDSVTINVFPVDQNFMFSYSFEKENNPNLPWDAIAEIIGNTVIVTIPDEIPIDSLIATFVISNCAAAYINETMQISGITSNDFESPVIYDVTAPNGDVRQYVVVVDIETGYNDTNPEIFTIFPNPSDGRFGVEFAGIISIPVKIEVLDLMGIVVYKNLAITTNEVIDLSGQPKGMYFVRVQQGDNSWTSKFIIR
jgi:hypothetical protein